MPREPSGLRFQVADSELAKRAIKLRESVYGRDLGHVPDDGLDDRATHFVAVATRGEVISSFRLLGPELRPFDLESSVDLEALLGCDARPALVGRLCVHPAYRRIPHSVSVHTGLLELALCYCRENKISDLLLYTYDNLRRFYRAARFVDTCQMVNHPDWGTVHLMWRHLRDPSDL
jgi:predicted GNAT family N-acyltransferase